MPFNFPDPAVSTTATNPVTGAKYQWKADPGKWVLTGGPSAVTPPVTIDLLPPESPQVGDLWIHQESLIEYAWDGTQWFEVGSSCGGKSEEEEEEDSNVPFTNSYKLVSPDNFNGEDGTATLETDAYANGDDSFLSPTVEIARFAERDLNGKKHEAVSKDESFELAPTTYETSDSIKPAYGIFKVTSLEGSTEYSVDYDSSRAFRFIEGDTVYYRPSLTGYVKKEGGDTMEGPLEITGPRSAGSDPANPDIESTLKVLNIENRNSSYLGLKHNGATKVYIGGDDVSIANDIKFNRSAGSTIKSNVQDLLNISDREIAYLGQSIEDEDLITKKYVDDTKDFLQNEIIELEEEIEALAPSVERGKWIFTAVGTVANPGQFTMYDADFGNGNPTGLFKSAKSIWFNEIDSDGTPHAFGDVDDGELLEIFVEGSPEYGLYEVVGEAHDETLTGTKFWVIDVNFIRTLEDTTAIGPGELCRFKIFMAPTGGDASSFVMKTGDEMTGRLVIESEAELVDYTVPTGNDPRVEFKNTKSDGTTRSSVLFKTGDSNALACSSTFQATTLFTLNNLQGYQEKTEVDGTKTRVSKYPRITFLNDSNSPDDRNKDYGVLKFNNSDRLIWNKNGGNIQNDNGMVLDWNSSYGYLWLPKVGDTALTWGKDGVVVFRDSYGSFGTPGQVLTRTTDANYMQWATPATAGQVLTNWDLVNSNNKNWGNEFYHNALTTGFGGYKSNGAEYNGQSNYGIFISDSMLEKLLKEDYPDKEIDIDQWVKYWTGEGTIELNTGNSGASGTSVTRTLTEVKRVNYNNDGRYPGVKFMWADQASLSFYSLYIKFVKTAGAFEDTGEVNTIQVPASNILYYTGSYTPSREEDVNDSTVYWLDRSGRISNGSPSNGAFFPWAWVKENYPWMTGLNIMDGLGVSGIYDAYGNAKSLLDPIKHFNNFPAYVNPREFNGVRGIGIWSDNQMGSNDRIQLWGLQEAFEY